MVQNTLDEADPEAPPDLTAEEGLWRAALIMYRRCWVRGKSAVAKGTQRLQPLDAWLDEMAISHARETHNTVMALANHNVAHQVSAAEQYRMILFLAPTGEKRDVVGAGVLGVALSVPSDGIPVRLAEVAEGLRRIAEEQYETGRQLVIEQAREIGLDQLYRTSSS